MRTVDNQVLTALHQIRDAIKNKDCCNGGGVLMIPLKKLQ